jgi:hypothetical protein
MKNAESGKCHCGKVTFSVELPEKLEKYSSRKCDCDFCTEQNISYLSHPEGVLEITFSEPFETIQQGSNQARFLVCSSCKDIVAGVYQFHNHLMGAVNARLVNKFVRLQKPTSVSPKSLTPKEKLSRWESVWLKVRINWQNHL